MDGDDGLSDDFLDSLDLLTSIREGKRIGEEQVDAQARHSGADDRPSESRLSEFTPEELAYYGGDDEFPMRQCAIAEEQDMAEGDATEIDSAASRDGDHDGDGATAFIHPMMTVQLQVGASEQQRNGEYDHEEEETDEYADEVSQLESSDVYGSFYSESLLKASLPSYYSDGTGTERSHSFASECTEFSPLPSPQEVTLDRARTYEQRLEASVHETASQHGTDRGSQSNEQPQQQPRPFTMEDMVYFDKHFGRDVFLDELGTTFIDGSGSKSLASYRMSSVVRISQNKSDVIKQGWLMKRSEFVRSWHKRWFTLRRMPQGPMLTYSRDKAENAPAKSIDLSSTSRCMVAPKSSKEHEFRILTSADSSRREYAVYAASNYELSEWVRAIQSAINAGNKSAFEGSADFQRIWNETGIQGFLLRYGMRKVSSRNHLQTRVLELNFADQTITNSRRGESLTTLHFNDLLRVTTNKHGSEEFGLVLDFNGKHRSWPIFLDTREARDELMDIMQKIAIKEVIGEDLEARCSRLRLKSGHMERRNVGPQATLKGRLFVCLYEKCIMLYPEGEDVSCTRPWYVVTLKGLNVGCNEAKCMIIVGRLQLTCSSVDECRNWHHAILAAMSLPTKVIELELRERAKIRNTFHKSVFRLRKLLKANVKPEVKGPPKDIKTIELMIKKLWELTFPGEPFTSNSDPRWQEIGFQRGGPASDLRSSGLIGLYCLIYFVTYPSGEFQRILDRTRFGVSEGNMKNYPLAIGCINVAAMLTEIFGFGDAGSHSEGCSDNAMKTYVRFLAQSVAESKPKHQPGRKNESGRNSMSGDPLDSFDSWEEIVGEADNHVFEDIFCVLYPILDMLFVEMGAGYMEFGQVVAAFRRRVRIIFDSQPRDMEDLKQLAAEPYSETLVAPSIISKGMK